MQKDSVETGLQFLKEQKQIRKEKQSKQKIVYN
jgi:hypothetical protein